MKINIKKIEPKNHIKPALLQARDRGFFIVFVRRVSYSIDITDSASQCYIIAIGASTYLLNWSYLRIHINAHIIFIACRLLEPHRWMEPCKTVIGNKKQVVRSIQFMFYCLNSGVVSLFSMERQVHQFMTHEMVFFSYICNIM